MGDKIEALAQDEIDVDAARVALWEALTAEDGHRRAYSAVCRWTWRAMIDRRMDEDMRSWHRLILDLSGRLAIAPPPTAVAGGRIRLTSGAAAERLKGFADMVRLSVEAAEASPPKDLTSRAHVLEILRVLAAHPGTYVDREVIRSEIGLRQANLSRVLTLLAANGLIERRPRGKEAAFRATQRALAVVDASHAVDKDRARVETPPPIPVSRASGEKDRESFHSRVIKISPRTPFGSDYYAAPRVTSRPPAQSHVPILAEV